MYADLFLPLTKCPLEENADDCPFEKYWKLDDLERIRVIDTFCEEELEGLRNFHRKCLSAKIGHKRLLSARKYRD